MAPPWNPSSVDTQEFTHTTLRPDSQINDPWCTSINVVPSCPGLRAHMYVYRIAMIRQESSLLHFCTLHLSVCIKTAGGSLMLSLPLFPSVLVLWFRPRIPNSHYWLTWIGRRSYLIQSRVVIDKPIDTPTPYSHFGLLSSRYVSRLCQALAKTRCHTYLVITLNP